MPLQERVAAFRTVWTLMETAYQSAVCRETAPRILTAPSQAKFVARKHVSKAVARSVPVEMPRTAPRASSVSTWLVRVCVCVRRPVAHVAKTLTARAHRYVAFPQPAGHLGACEATRLRSACLQSFHSDEFGCVATTPTSTESHRNWTIMTRHAACTSS